MTKKDNILFADVGKLLTNGNAIGTIVTLSDNDSADNWYEIDEIDVEIGGETNG